MNYLETVAWLFQQLPMYQNKGKSAFKKDLSNTLRLAKHLKHPEEKFRSIHVGGTNGKGSTSHMMASILQEAGYKVGLYTSPHLKDFRERIRINGQAVSKQFVIGFVKGNKTFLEENSLSFFEMTVGMAFDYFALNKVDIAVIEVGLGGRLDSTNIIVPELAIITNIGYDHMDFLGDTLEKIATEKAGIIKSHIPVVIGETQKETTEVFLSKASSLNAQICFADQSIDELFESDLKGHYQIHNIKTVIQSVNILKKKGFNISQKEMKRGLLNVSLNTGLKGRWQILQHQPKVICDTAHNKEGLTYTMTQLLNETYGGLHIVFGMVNVKNAKDIIPILPKEASYYFCKPNVPRGLDEEILANHFLEFGIVGTSFSSVKIALNSALKNAKDNDLIYIGGSTFVVAEII
jgi:dihydrofolate synthase/folylpolyglutamate synthase